MANNESETRRENVASAKNNQRRHRAKNEMAKRYVMKNMASIGISSRKKIENIKIMKASAASMQRRGVIVANIK